MRQPLLGVRERRAEAQDAESVVPSGKRETEKRFGRALKTFFRQVIGVFENFIPISAPRQVADGRPAVEISDIHGGGFSELSEIVGAGGTFCRIPRPAQRRQQHGGENRDDGDDDQQFNQREILFLFHHSPPLF
ncbi:hypothetical protein SDC9_190611 [bioreactor metagenome]|uniref:Uncharacterized protein n=1 Tax=bioreactor metagenome TaxID=1076179 RepID=A0A645HX45_9ZZZZ